MSIRPDIHSQTKKTIFSVYKYFKQLSNDKSNLEVANFFKQAQQITAEACEVSIATVRRITSEASKSSCSESESEPKFTSPRKTFKRMKYATDIDDFDGGRRTVHEFYDNREYPTTQKIVVSYKEKTGYSGRFLMERNDIVAMHVKFLRKMCNLRLSNDTRPVVYLVGQPKSFTRSNLAKCPNYGRIKGTNWESFKLVLRCKSNATHPVYHTQMNDTIFKKWFIDMLNNLEEPCVIIMDNASYHSVYSVNYPKSNAIKSSVQQWLRKNGVDFSPLETLSELRERVKSLIPKEKKYELDEIALQMGHEVVRLPPYHCQYNPIELIWAQVKEEVAKNNTTFKFDDVEKLLNDALDSVTVDNWKKCTDHCHNLQEDFIKEGLRDEILTPIILTINPDDSSDGESDNEES
ncbi:DDE 3 domain-containing protein [Aphis craccivora]|uniref:DDE 3 domain-containing protein n=1 Tax=Aphis craccivora TaxID=307492 RepID=A0A6G0XXB7_APHCR|nr:DDE 3 domain-containing protein [Aphis craccivora]